MPLGLFKTTAVTPVVYDDWRVARIWLSSLIILQCDCAAVMQSYSARWVWGQNKYPWLFLERRVITGVHMTLSDIFISYCCWPTWALLALGNFKRNNSIFSSTGDAGQFVFFPLSIASQCWRLYRQGIILHMMQHNTCFSWKVGLSARLFSFQVSLHSLHSPPLFKIEIGLLQGFVGHVLLIFSSEIWALRPYGHLGSR